MFALNLELGFNHVTSLTLGGQLQNEIKFWKIKLIIHYKYWPYVWLKV